MAGLRREDGGAQRIGAQPVPAAIGVACLEQALRDFTAATDPDKLAGKAGVFLLKERIADYHAGRVEARRFRLLPLLTAMDLEEQHSTFKSGNGPLQTIATIVEDLPPYRVGGRTYAVEGPNHKQGRALLLYFDVVLREDGDRGRGDVAAIPSDLRACAASLLEEHGRGLLLTLLVDRYPHGLWGYSLESAESAYRHPDARERAERERGSLTIAQRALDAMREATTEAWQEEVDAFTHALNERRIPTGPAAGGVGMEIVASNVQKNVVRYAHPRHTAIATYWWATAARTIQTSKYVVEALGYLARVRYEGGWGDADSSGDAITTAYVTRVLCDLDADLAAIPDLAQFRATFADAALLWLHEELALKGGWWLLRTASGPADAHPRVYAMTADVAAAVPEFAAKYPATYDNVLARLGTNWQGAGIPLDPGAAAPDLSATALFAQAHLRTAHHAADRAWPWLHRYCATLPTLLEEGVADATGWSAALAVLTTLAGSQLDAGTVASVRTHAAALHSDLKADAAILAAYAPWVARHVAPLLARRRARTRPP